MEKVITLEPIDWQKCHIDLSIFRQGPPSEKGRHSDISIDILTAWRLDEGSVKVKMPKTLLSAEAGEWLFLPAGSRRQDFSSDARVTVFGFRIFWESNYRPALDISPGLHIRRAAQLDAAVRSLHSQLGSPSSYTWHSRGLRRNIEDNLLIEGGFRMWLSEAVRLWRQHLPDLENQREEDPRVQRALRWIINQPVDSPLVDIGPGAKKAGVSPRHLSRLFLQHYHQTPHSFHQQRRLQYARQELLAPGSRIKYVASKLGFSDLSKFSSWFRRLEQMSPRQYRARQLGSDGI
ncbi:MAG: AraC family transcriptional regulator [Verrucomicrobiota bacterium JB024]|nr:AraC family transcriptional regulator [Verrucomicrobiota bacterium JB024]